MKPTLFLALTITTGGAALAHAATVSTSASATIADPTGGIQVLSNTVLPTVISGNPANVSARAGAAALTIRTQAGDTLSMAVPESFQVVRDGGTEGLTVKTTTDTELSLSKGGVVLGGSQVAGGTMSVNVGGLVNLASNNLAAPGAYAGTLVVLVQYN